MRTAQTGQNCAKNLNILWFEPIEKQVHIIRAPLSRLCVSTCPMRLSYVCVHVSPAIQNFTNAFIFIEKLKSQNL